MGLDESNLPAGLDKRYKGFTEYCGIRFDSITDDIDQLADFPELGPPLSSIADVDAGYRFLVTGNYLSFYRINGADISIDRILSGRRDYLSVLIEGMF